MIGQLHRIDAVVFDGIRQPHQLGVLKAGHGAVHAPLHVLGKGGRHALHVPFHRVQPLRLHEDGMAFLVGEAHHLVLDGGAVARAGALDLAGIHRRQMQVFANDLVRFGRCVGEIAQRAVFQRRRVRQEGKRHDRRIALLRSHLREIDRAHVHARGRAGFEAADGKAVVQQRLREPRCGDEPLRAALPRALADDDAAFQIHARAQHRRAAADFRTRRRFHAANLAVFHDQPPNLALPERQPRLILHRGTHPRLVGHFVRLRAQGIHGRAFAGVQHARLDERIVDGAAHFAAQRVQLAHQVPLAGAADGGIAGHHGHAVQIQRQKQRALPHARARKRGFATRVPRAHHDQVKFLGKQTRFPFLPSAVLTHIQIRVESVLLQKLLVAAHFHDPAVLHGHDHVRGADG